MRLRNIKGSREAVANDIYVIKEPEKLKGNWKSIFGNDNPIHLEIGTGKGKFITEMALQNPDINYLGIEKYSSVLFRALEKRREVEINNLYYLRFDAVYLLDIFAENEIERIYLNFSDPWPKERHAKRRLTSRNFLNMYDKCLKKDGEVIFKTDNKDLFEFSLNEVKEAGWKFKAVTYDLHNSEFAKGNIMTEYEEKFVSQGKPIYMMKICR
ncbi:tRNA (guanine-N7-)-methyltransferase [Herbinix hemicellulosilytica]|uniref:tRNA (guanine-N(7)-)-methyltransferase n=1 Tax=Herbinix hemicellulosilytica TaxID=1564487 RepID=A0A0H5SKN6_HERHM|nr:tRNA (guanosine(46)-N7)-methyltransferase TrmB [Herbinix hemicellulosilytica]RBP57413.1 tRNA (guanine-N7-)-methyltransferase [Herbinix hemicellulosilytica]CRZ35675.1 tRNA (guanine-N(7)-)-methyltransferase [Herbinix hemicellulosilytica]